MEFACGPYFCTDFPPHSKDILLGYPPQQKAGVVLYVGYLYFIWAKLIQNEHPQAVRPLDVWQYFM